MKFRFTGRDPANEIGILFALMSESSIVLKLKRNADGEVLF